MKYSCEPWQSFSRELWCQAASHVTPASTSAQETPDWTVWRGACADTKLPHGNTRAPRLHAALHASLQAGEVSQGARTEPQADCGLSSMSGVSAALTPAASSSARPHVQFAHAFFAAPASHSPIAAQQGPSELPHVLTRGPLGGDHRPKLSGRLCRSALIGHRSYQDGVDDS